MKDSTKQALAIMLPYFIFGMVRGILQDKLTSEMYLVLFIITLVVMVFFVKKFTPKSFKNDEIMRKLAIMNDAVAARTAMVVLFVIFAAEFYLHFSITEFFGLEYFYLVGFIFIAMCVASLVSHIYYSRNPHKLP